MRRLELMPFQASTIVAPSTEQIRAAVFDLPYKGDSGLHFVGDGPGASLVITSHNELGFCVVLELSDGRSLALSASPEDRGLVETWLCQNPVRMPRSHFVSVENAFSAALAFAKDTENGGTQTAGRVGPWVTFCPEEPR